MGRKYLVENPRKFLAVLDSSDTVHIYIMTSLLKDRLYDIAKTVLPAGFRYWLGTALIEAEGEYRVELKDHPHDVWSLCGLQSALAAKNQQDPEVGEDFAVSTPRMDVRIIGSRI